MTWLINVHSGKLEKFQNNFPRYAILSHTWGEEKDEIHFGDIQKDHQLSKTGPGRIKFDGCCQQAKADGFDYVWIDTCCIDKSHHTDYSEAITSMFSWYQTAGRCYAYLADVPDKSASTFDNDFRRSRWHTRGWTLQELLAPQDLVFYSQSWTKLGEKASMTSMIEKATGIPAQFLGGFRDASVAQRMSWAAQRVTTRGEDMAYCLFGIFNVSLPIMYGEGASAAFSRLQEAILQRTPDASILAWGLDLQHDGLSSQRPSIRYGHLLAASPLDFVNCGTVVPCESGPSGQRLDVNRGYYHLQLPLYTTKAGHAVGLLKCYSSLQQKGCIGIPLCQVEPGSETDEFMRPKGIKAIQLFDTDSSQEPSNLRIRDLSLAEDIRKFDCRYGYSIEVPASSKLAVFDVYPKDRWDACKRFGITGVDFLRDTKQVSWIRLRHNEEQSPDFVVMLELEISSSQPQLTCHLMVASRSMGLDTLAREIPALPSLSRFTGRERASNGWCNLTVKQTTKCQGGYVVYELSFAELEKRQIDYPDTASEIELVACDRRLQFLFEEDIQLGQKVSRAACSVLEKQADIKYKETRLLSMKKELERLPLELAESERVLKSLTKQDERLQEKKNGILQSISSLSERLPMGVGVQRLMQWHNSVAQSLSRTLPAQDADIESIFDERISVIT